MLLSKLQQAFAVAVRQHRTLWKLDYLAVMNPPAFACFLEEKRPTILILVRR